MNAQLSNVPAQQRHADPHRAADRTRLPMQADGGRRSSGDPRPADVLVLADGTRLALRPLGAADRDGLAALFARLSPESRYRRFLSPKPRLTPRELVYLTDIDRFHHEAIAAVDPRDGSIAGVGRYVRYSDRPSVAEVAFEVVDELQNMGIGTALATHIVQHARANGIARLSAATLWDNRPARAILRRFQFRARGSQGSVIELELELDSLSAGEWRDRAADSELDAPDANDGTRQTRDTGSDSFRLLTPKEPHEPRN